MARLSGHALFPHDHLREPRRYLPAVLAVAFSDVLITVQVGLLLGALCGALAADRPQRRRGLGGLSRGAEHRAGLPDPRVVALAAGQHARGRRTRSPTSMGSATGASRRGAPRSAA